MRRGCEAGGGASELDLKRRVGSIPIYPCLRPGRYESFLDRATQDSRQLHKPEEAE